MYWILIYKTQPQLDLHPLTGRKLHFHCHWFLLTTVKYAKLDNINVLSLNRESTCNYFIH